MWRELLQPSGCCVHLPAAAVQPKMTAVSNEDLGVRVMTWRAIAEHNDMQHNSWTCIPLTEIRSHGFQRTALALKHRRHDALLILHRPLSRNSTWSERVGIWCLICEGRLVGRRAAYGRRPRAVPWRWATHSLRVHLASGGDPTFAHNTSVQSSIERVIESLPASFAELPAVVAGHHSHIGVPVRYDFHPGDPDVPAAIPLLPPRRCAVQRRVHSKEEFALYVATWRAWVTDHPDLDDAGRTLLEGLCMETVLLHRLRSLWRGGSVKVLSRSYHATFLRRARCKEALVAACRWME